MNLPGCVQTGSGGLSGEHIQLCAEGARRKPNLSGKWTEKLEVVRYSLFSGSPARGCLFLFVNIRNEVIYYARKNPGFHWICLTV